VGETSPAHWWRAPIDASGALAEAVDVTRLMIFVQHPRHLSSEEAESWLEKQLDALTGEGLEQVRLKRMNDASLGIGDRSAWRFELDCRDADAAREMVRDGAGRALLMDLRLLGMRPSVDLVDEDR
jgi:hypothetical protein